MGEMGAENISELQKRLFYFLDFFHYGSSGSYNFIMESGQISEVLASFLSLTPRSQECFHTCVTFIFVKFTTDHIFRWKEMEKKFNLENGRLWCFVTNESKLKSIKKAT